MEIVTWFPELQIQIQTKLPRQQNMKSKYWSLLTLGGLGEAINAELSNNPEAHLEELISDSNSGPGKTSPSSTAPQMEISNFF